ncbi:MAG: dienelactone hydrolase family protein [Acidimicrobiales bacterium]
MATTVTLSSGGGDMAVYEAEPDGEVRGGVLVLQEAFGVNDHIEDVTRRFARAGYRAVAPHLFHRSGDEHLDYGNFEKIMPHMQALSEKGLLEDVDACLAHLAAAGLPAGRVGVVGFCMGGSVTFLVAARRVVGAAVTFYGGGVAEGRFGMAPLVEMAPSLQAPWLGLFGDQDQGIPVDQVEALRAAAAAAPVPTEIARYAEAGHGFHCDARPDSYNQDAAEDGWRRTLAWFAEYLG